MASPDDNDPNRVVVHMVEITLLDAKQPNGSSWHVIGRGATPEDAMRDAEKDAAAMHAATARLLNRRAQ